MAIVFPRELPSYHLTRGSIDLMDNTAVTPSGGGSFLNVTQTNDPVWRLSLETGLLYPETVAEWSAWKKSLRGGLRHFLAADVRRRKPRAHPNLTALVANIVSMTRTTITINGVNLPANFKATVGDRIGLEQNGRFGYYEVVETVQRAGTSNMVLSVEPFIHTSYFNTNATCRLVDAKAKFVIDWQSWSEPETKEAASVSFIGMQRI